MDDQPLGGDALFQRFQALDRLLTERQALWRPQPFTQHRLPWEDVHPELGRWLRSRSLEQAEADHHHPQRLQAPSPWPDLARQSDALSRVGELPQRVRPTPPARLALDVPGRKWQQIQAFASSLSFQSAPLHWLDWCAGKGHLGRLLAHDGTPLTCLEHDRQLIEDGHRLSQRLGLTAHHLQQDVLAADALERLAAHHTPVALHACGDLHVRLLQLASRAGCRQLAIAPCCYNRIATPSYQPLSAPARASALQLSLEDLALPLRETVTAGARVRRQRDLSMARRLAFDLLQRQLRGSDDYLPTPSLPPAWLDKSLASYCQDLASLKGLPAPDPATDWSRLEQQGWRRLAEVRNLELLRALFRRPLELWLLLDRALYLQEQGFAVRLGSFCAHHLSPRNLLLLAERP
ncbi:methyltransferase [Pseudomonas lalucatii]|uniref:Methyltransferase n=1 Tax=Pseudomonas lalucatii TaxID=1424203 RepID=A0ABS5Q169_9PSED|nr:methyltransferase [Pseudomonas lalucatii]MBS7662394.1 methyltransferase [Pseudomonas lalucatii]